jgi:hypothetical protein
MQKCDVDVDLFTNNFTKESVYLMGYLWADGYLYKNRLSGQKITLGIVENDAKHLNSIFNKTGKWLIYNRKQPNRQPQQSFVCTHVELYNFLHSYNYNNRAIGTNIVNIFPKKIQHYWFLGVFDGDGCWYYNKKQYLRQMSIAGCYDQNWDFITNKLDELNCNYKICRRTQGKNKNSIIRMSSKQDMYNFGCYIYQDRNIGLKRKLDKFDNIINSYIRK